MPKAKAKSKTQERIEKEIEDAKTEEELESVFIKEPVADTTVKSNENKKETEVVTNNEVLARFKNPSNHVSNDGVTCEYCGVPKEQCEFLGNK